MATQQKILGFTATVPRGDWNATTSYNQLNLVRHKTASFYSKVNNNQGIEPFVTQGWEDAWQVCALDGDKQLGVDATVLVNQTTGEASAVVTRSFDSEGNPIFNFVFNGIKGERGESGTSVNIVSGRYYDSSLTYPSSIPTTGLTPLPSFASTAQGEAYVVDDNVIKGQVDLYFHGQNGTNWTIIDDWGGIPGQAATIEIGTVTTLPAGSQATVQNVGTQYAARLNFGIPQGEQGPPGVSALEVYGVRIDTTDSNPETAVVYTDDAIGFTPARGNNGNYQRGTIEDCYPYNQIRPCLFKNGAVVGYLNPTNFAQFADGTSADITSGNAGDVMIEIPHFYYKFDRVGDYLNIKITSIPREGYTDWAFSYKGVVKDKFYVGAYLGYVDGNSKLRSLSGKTTTGSKTIGAFRTAAQANGDGYEQMPFNKITALQILYLLLFKSLNSQSALGRGYVDANDYHSTSGVTDTRGMNYGTTSGSSVSDCIKLFGMEDFWGNKLIWIDGFMTGNNAIKVADGNFNDAADGYTQYLGTGASVSGYFKDVVGDNVLAFSPKLNGASGTTYFCDYGYINLTRAYVPIFGGSYDDGEIAGAFQLYCAYSVSLSNARIGARLTYCG